MNDHTWNIGTILLTLLGVLGPISAYLWRTFRYQYQRFDKLEKSNKISLKKMRRWEPLLQTLAPNGGKSLYDAIRRLECSIGAIEDQLVLQNHLKKNLHPDTPSYESDRHGKWTWTNQALDELCGVKEGYLLSHSWIRSIQADLREEAQTEWERAVKVGVPFHLETTVINEATLAFVEVTYKATPILNNSNQVVGYSGTVVRRTQ